MLTVFSNGKETINYMINAAVWSRSAVLYEMNLQQATPEGTLAAAAGSSSVFAGFGHRCRLADASLYPIRGGRSQRDRLSSCYSIRDYRAVDPELGTLADSTLLFGGLTPWE